jgi:hypothetical protein
VLRVTSLSLPLRADVQLAERQQRIADELREEYRLWPVSFDAIDLYVPQLEWDAWNKRLRNAINRKKRADQAVSAVRARAPTGSSAASGGAAAEPPAAAPAADLSAAACNSLRSAAWVARSVLKTASRSL